MPQEKMDFRWRVPAGIRPACTFQAIGVIQRGTTAQLVAGPQRWRANVALTIDDHCFDCSACGDVARSISECSAGTIVKVGGRLLQHRWLTGEGIEKSKIDLRIEHMEVLGTCEKEHGAVEHT